MPNKTDLLTVDIDINYEEYLKSSKFTRFMMNLRRVLYIKEVKMRRSATGRTHIMVMFRHPIEIQETFFIRAYLGDDPYRLACDLTRYFIHRDYGYTGRLFDEKFKGGEIKKAGEWHDIGIIPEQEQKTIEDWDEQENWVSQYIRR